jgi:LysR family glycine cleavage system transcriptional activator
MVGLGRFPSLAAIRAFEAAARLGSFAAAARELGTSAASVSYHVRHLEDEIGVALFRRHPHRVALTAGGALVAREATNAFAALRASFTRALDADESFLSLTTLPTLGTSWLTPKLGRFRAANPEIRIELDLSASPEDLGAGAFDVAIRNGHGRWPGLRAVPLFPAIFMPLRAPSFVGAAEALTDPPRPTDVPLLGRPDWWGLWFRARGFTSAPPPSRFGTSLPVEHLDVAAAIAGQGIAIASPILFRDEIEAGRLVPAHEFVAGDGRSFWLAFPAARRQSRKVAAFRQWLCEEAARDSEASARFIQRAVIVEP